MPMGFPANFAEKESTCNAGDPGSIPGLGRSPEEGIGNPLQYSCASLVVQMVKNLTAMRETWVQSLVEELRSHMPWGRKAHMLQQRAHRTQPRPRQNEELVQPKIKGKLNMQLKNYWLNEEIKGEIKNYSKTNENATQDLWGERKPVLRERFIEQATSINKKNLK